jgi:hypothetical protein
MFGSAPPMCVDIHPGKLREVRFIPGIVGKKVCFATFRFAMSAVCAFRKFFDRRGNKFERRQLSKPHGF